MKRECKYKRSIIPAISIKRTIISHLNILNTKKTKTNNTTYDVVNQRSCFEQAQPCGGFKSDIGISNPLLIIGSPMPNLNK